MKLVLRLVETGMDGSSRSVDVLEIVGRSDPGDIAALGVTLSQGKQLLALTQQEVVAAQCRDNVIKLADIHPVIVFDETRWLRGVAFATSTACRPCGSRGGAVPCAAGMSALAGLARPCGRRQ